MVYEAEGFSKTAARKDTWENFIDNYIFPERTYVQESEEKTPTQQLGKLVFMLYVICNITILLKK